jgi:hypothetical protein
MFVLTLVDYLVAQGFDKLNPTDSILVSGNHARNRQLRKLGYDWVAFLFNPSCYLSAGRVAKRRWLSRRGLRIETKRPS